MNKKIYDIIVIGAGSAGIACIIEAKLKNIENVLLIEKTSNHSQTIRKFYKDGKRVDKDWKNQITKLEGNIPFTDGTKESTLDYNYFSGLDILKYWRNTTQYPELSVMAHDVLSIPITTAVSKFTFSMEDHVLNKYKSSLLSKKIQTLICTQN